MTARLLTRHGAPGAEGRKRDAANWPPVAEARVLREPGLLPLTEPIPSAYR